MRVSGIALHDGPVAAGTGDLVISLALLPREDRLKRLDIAFELAPGERRQRSPSEALTLVAEPKGGAARGHSGPPGRRHQQRQQLAAARRSRLARA